MVRLPARRSRAQMNGRFARRLIPRKKTPVGQTEEEESSSFKDEESDSEEFTSGFDSEESHMVVPKSVLIGESGYYQIHKIFVPIGEPKRRGGRFAVGVTLRTKEWLAADLRHSFPGFTSCSVIYTVGKGSLAEQAGVRPNDILCWFKGPEPVVFHILVSSAQNHSCAWELIEQAQFEEHLKSVQDENSFTFYVARKMPAASPAHPSFVVNGITLSNEVAVKAETFHSLCSEGKWKLMKEIKEDAKKNFEADRDAVLASLPESFKGSFNQIGFAKWGQKYWPVLVLSPYRIPPGNVRNLWLTKFELRKKNNTLHKMNYLVSWYCVKDPTKRYAIIPHENFVTWSEGKVKHQQSLSTSIQDELAAELKKEKSRRGAAQFEELYKLITEQDLEEIALYSTASVVASESSVNRRRKRDDSDDRCSFRLKIRYSQNEPQNSTSVSPEREGVDTLNGTYDNDDKPLAVDFARARTSIMAAFSGSPSQSEPGKHYDRSAFAEGRPDFKQATEDGSDSKEAAECVRHAESPRSGNSITTSHSTSEETQAVTQELTGRTIVETAEDFVSTFCSNANAVLLENKTLRSGIMKLEVEMHAIRQEHIRSLQQLKRYDATVNEDDDDDEVVNKGYVSATQLTEIVVPALSIDDVNYFEASAAYFRTTIAQNTVLRRIFGELAAQLEIEKATRLQLEGEVNQWKAHYDALMRCLQQLTKKSREYIKG